MNRYEFAETVYGLGVYHGWMTPEQQDYSRDDLELAIDTMDPQQVGETISRLTGGRVSAALVRTELEDVA